MKEAHCMINDNRVNEIKNFYENNVRHFKSKSEAGSFHNCLVPIRLIVGYVTRKLMEILKNISATEMEYCIP